MSVFRTRAIQRVNALFTWRSVAESVSNVYESVLASRQEFGLDSQYRTTIDGAFAATIAALRKSQQDLRNLIGGASEMIAGCYERGGKLLICGNGGSAADAQHFAAELVGRFKIPDRPGLPAVALTADSAVMTAWSNDAGFADAFARQVQALGGPGDVLIGISTSGRASNVIAAFEEARRARVRTIAILGGDGGKLRELADVPIVVPAEDTQRIQEVQILLVHLLCELVEERLFGGRAAPERIRDAARQPSNVRRLGAEAEKHEGGRQPVARVAARERRNRG